MRVTPLKLCPSCTQLFTRADGTRHTYLGQFTQPVSRYTARYTSKPPGRLFLLLKPHRVHSKVHFNIARTSPELPARMNRARHNLWRGQRCFPGALSISPIWLLTRGWYSQKSPRNPSRPQNCSLLNVNKLHECPPAIVGDGLNVFLHDGAIEGLERLRGSRSLWVWIQTTVMLSVAKHTLAVFRFLFCVVIYLLIYLFITSRRWDPLIF